MYISGEYIANNPTWHEEDSPWKAGKVVSMLARNGINPASVAELGCGAGEILRCLAQRLPACSFVGYEVSPQAFEILRRKQGPGLECVLGDGFSDGRRFDLAMAIDVFEHVDDYIGFLRQMKGKAVHKLYHIPLDLSAQSVARDKLIGVRRSVGHLHHFCKETALATLTYTDHRILDWQYTAGAIEAPSRSAKARLLSLPRRALYAVAPDTAVRLLGGYSLMVLCA